MSNISIGQFIIIFLLCFLIFGDFSKFIKNTQAFIKTLNSQKKIRKKGS